MEPTVEQVFGTGTTVTATHLSIPLAGLYTDPSGTKTAESLLVALFQKASTHLTQANFNSNIAQSIIIGDISFGATGRGDNLTPYRFWTKTLSAYKIDTDTVIDPDDY